MGIDIYLKWKKQTRAEQKAQVTGFSIVHGNVGYLREAYHGGPYATAYLITEDWDQQPDEGFQIPAVELKQRLPAAVLASIYRHHVLYGENDDPGLIGLGDLVQKMTAVFADMKNVQNREFLPNEEQTKAVSELIEKRALPPYALSFVDFVALAEAKEKETGEPCTVIVSN